MQNGVKKQYEFRLIFLNLPIVFRNVKPVRALDLVILLAINRIA
jgi:hypothetical protein